VSDLGGTTRCLKTPASIAIQVFEVTAHGGISEKTSYW